MAAEITPARAQTRPAPDPFAVTDPADLPPRYPAAWAADVVLRDGGTAHLRPIVPGDREAVQAMHLAQSDQSRYLRFFAPLPRLSERDLDRFTEVDYLFRVALVAIVHNRIVGIGRYDVVRPGEAEVAFYIADSEHGRGLGSVLLEHLSAAARDRGVTRFMAEVLPENTKMVAVFTDAGYELTQSCDDGVLSLGFDLVPTTRSIDVVAARERRAEAASLRQILRASSVAVLGASDAVDSLGRRFVQNIVDGGFAGAVYPVHPSGVSVCGRRGYSSIAEIGAPIDIAIVCVGLDAVVAAAQQCGDAGVRGLIVVTDGFIGDHGAALAAELAHDSRAAGMRVIGPASFGLVNTDPAVRLNASLLPSGLRSGGLALFSQSAGLGVSLLGEAAERGLAISSVVSAGDRADVSGNDLLQFWAEDEATTVIAMYTESSGNPRKFSRIARAVSQVKPVVLVRAWTSGLASRSTTGRRSRTTRATFDAMLAQAGVIQVPDVRQLAEIVHLFVEQPLPTGRRVGIVTNSELLRSLVDEACHSGDLDPLSRAIAVRELSRDGVANALARASDTAIDSVVIALLPGIDGLDDDVLEAISSGVQGWDKPVVGCVVGQQLLGDQARTAVGAVPLYPSPHDAVRALAAVTKYAVWRQRDRGTPVDPPGCQPGRARAIVEEHLATAQHPSGLTLDQHATWELLDCYGIHLVQGRALGDGVGVDVRTVEDPLFGPIVSFGLSGDAVDLLGDVGYGIPPMTTAEVADLVRGVKASPRLFGHGGRPPVAVDALEDLVARVSRMAEDLPEIARCDLPSVLVTANSVAPGSARIRLAPPPSRVDTGLVRRL